MDSKVISFKSPDLILAGNGVLEKIGAEAKARGTKKALVVTDKGVVDSGIGGRVEGLLAKEGIGVDIWDRVLPDPDISCAEDCIETAKAGGYDLIVGVGGGSSMDIASVASMMCTNPGTVHDYFGVGLLKKPGIPTFLVATTAGTGAEVTPNAILADTAAKLKKGIVSPYILPQVAIVDPLLTISMPPRVTSFSGMDALAHAVEAYTSINATTLTDMYAREAIMLIGKSLRTAVARGTNVAARYDMSLGSLYAGIALANAGVTAVHALAYPLGGEFEVAHGIANGLLLPHVMEFNVPGDIPKFAQIAFFLGERVEHLALLDQARHAAEAVKNLVRDLDMPQTLNDLKIPRDAIPKLAEAAMKVTRLMNNNPRNMTAKDAEKIFENAF
jgi:alcohol dehydrogenase class IV